MARWGGKARKSHTEGAFGNCTVREVFVLNNMETVSSWLDTIKQAKPRNKCNKNKKIYMKCTKSLSKNK